MQFFAFAPVSNCLAHIWTGQKVLTRESNMSSWAFRQSLESGVHRDLGIGSQIYRSNPLFFRQPDHYWAKRYMDCSPSSCISWVPWMKWSRPNLQARWCIRIGRACGARDCQTMAPRCIQTWKSLGIQPWWLPSTSLGLSRIHKAQNQALQLNEGIR